jgi:glucosamine-6-phosphate isomerase
MKITIYPDYKSLSRATADLVAGYIRTKKDSLICLASGDTPRGVFDCLVEDVKSKRLDLSQCTFVSLDEWVGIPAGQKGSCRAMMDENLFIPLQVPMEQIKFFNGMADDLPRELERINNLISEHGGLDIMLVGVGTNGHIAMNEPGTSFDVYAHISTLADETKEVGQKYFAATTKLDKGITLGLKHFRETRLPILMANGQRKTAIVKKTLSSTAVETLPASIIHLIDHGFVMLDAAAASETQKI